MRLVNFLGRDPGLHDAFSIVVVVAGHVIDYLAGSSSFAGAFSSFSSFSPSSCRREASLSTNAPRNVAIATAGYQLAFWLAESEGCPPESGAECRVSWAEVLTRRGSAGSKREREGCRDGERETKKERRARAGV